MQMTMTLTNDDLRVRVALNDNGMVQVYLSGGEVVADYDKVNPLYLSERQFDWVQDALEIMRRARDAAQAATGKVELVAPEGS